VQITVGNLFEGLEFHEVLEGLDACEAALSFQGDKCIIDTIEAMQRVVEQSSYQLEDLRVFWAWTYWLAVHLEEVFRGRNNASAILMFGLCQDVSHLDADFEDAMSGLAYARERIRRFPAARLRDMEAVLDEAEEKIRIDFYTTALDEVLKGLKDTVLPAYREETGEQGNGPV
jgi:hypothetical protein